MFFNLGQNTSLFGGSTSNQSTFGQTATFSTSNNQTTNSFLKPQTSVFGNATSSGNAFGGTSAPGATIFGAAPTTAVSNASTGSVFGQPTAAGTAFGGAPVFGGSSGFGPNQVRTLNFLINTSCFRFHQIPFIFYYNYFCVFLAIFQLVKYALIRSQ